MSTAVELAIVLAARDMASGALGQVESRFGGLAKAGLALAGTFAGVGTAVAAAGFSFNNMRQQSEIAFTTMLGSGEKAKQFLDDLQSFAARTPFEFEGLVRGSQRLLAMGFSADQVLPTLTAVGDAVAGLGLGTEGIDRVTRALGQMQAKGKVSAEEMLQLAEAGIPAWDFLAKKLGVDVATAQEMVRKGAVDAARGIEALTEGMNTKFGGLMEKQSRTFGGLVSTVKDTFQILSGTVMAPFFELATTAIGKLADFLSSPAVTEGAQRFADSVAVGIGRVGQALEIGRQTFHAFVGFFQQAVEGDIGGAMDAASELFANFGIRLPEPIRAGVEAVANLMRDLQQAVQLVMLGDIPGALKHGWAAWTEFRNGVVSLIVDALPQLLETFNGWARAAVGWITEKALPGLGAELPKIATATLSFVMATGTKLADSLTAFARAFFEWVGPAIPPLVGELLKLLSVALAWIGDNAENIGKTLVSWALKFAEVIVTVAIPKLIEVLPGILLTIGTWVVTEGIPGVFRFATRLAGGIISGLIEGLADLGPKAFNAITGAIRNAIASIDFWVGPFHVTGRGVSFHMPNFANTVAAQGGAFLGGHASVFGGGIEGIRHSGGPIFRSGLYELEAGEHVLSRRQVQQGVGGPTVHVHGNLIGLTKEDLARELGKVIMQQARLAGATS